MYKVTVKVYERLNIAKQAHIFFLSMNKRFKTNL